MVLKTRVVYDEEKEITKLPYEIEVGTNAMNHVPGLVPGREWMRLYYYTAEGCLVEELAAYTVSGDTLTITPVTTYSYDEENKHVSYQLSETSITYTYSLRGLNPVLERDGKSVELHSSQIGSDEHHTMASFSEFSLRATPTAPVLMSTTRRRPRTVPRAFWIIASPVKPVWTARPFPAWKAS